MVKCQSIPSIDILITHSTSPSILGQHLINISVDILIESWLLFTNMLSSVDQYVRVGQHSASHRYTVDCDVKGVNWESIEIITWHSTVDAISIHDLITRPSWCNSWFCPAVYCDGRIVTAGFEPYISFNTVYIVKESICLEYDKKFYPCILIRALH